VQPNSSLRVGDRVVLKGRPVTGKGILERKERRGVRFLLRFDEPKDPPRWVYDHEVMPERVPYAVE
jgi:hypothetical protein